MYNIEKISVHPGILVDHFPLQMYVCTCIFVEGMCTWLCMALCYTEESSAVCVDECMCCVCSNRSQVLNRCLVSAEHYAFVILLFCLLHSVTMMSAFDQLPNMNHTTLHCTCIGAFLCIV